MSSRPRWWGEVISDENLAWAINYHPSPCYHRRGFIGSYCGKRYHLKEYGAQYLALRMWTIWLLTCKINISKMMFSLLNECFPFFTYVPRNYPFKMQVKISNTYVVLNNIIMMWNNGSDDLYQHCCQGTMINANHTVDGVCHCYIVIASMT